MLIVKCTCGERICIVPDLHAMSTAIKMHANKHRKEDRERVEDYLNSEIVTAIASANGFWQGHASTSFPLGKQSAEG
jgi:hypothetical protein